MNVSWTKTGFRRLCALWSGRRTSFNGVYAQSVVRATRPLVSAGTVCRVSTMHQLKRESQNWYTHTLYGRLILLILLLMKLFEELQLYSCFVCRPTFRCICSLRSLRRVHIHVFVILLVANFIIIHFVFTFWAILRLDFEINGIAERD